MTSWTAQRIAHRGGGWSLLSTMVVLARWRCRSCCCGRWVVVAGRCRCLSDTSVVCRCRFVAFFASLVSQRASSAVSITCLKLVHITERRVPELIPVLGSQPAGDVSHKPGGRLPSLSARPAVTPATLNRTATNFAAWWTEAQWVWTVCLRLLPRSVATAIWTRALLRLSPAR